MRTRAAAFAGVLLALAASGCGGSPKASPAPTPTGSTSSTATPTPITPTVSPTLEPSNLRTTTTVGGVLSVGVPGGWVVRRSGDPDGGGFVCLAPRGDTKVVFDCAGVAFYYGAHLPGAQQHSYAPDQENGWYAATDVQRCPFVKGTGSGLVGINTDSGFSKGIKEVGDHRADWNRWTASCAGRTFHPQAWYLPKSKVVIFDYLGHRSTAAILASVTFASDDVSLPAAPTLVSGHLVSATATTVTVQPFHTFTNDSAGKAYAKAHGLEYPFPNDYLDADEGAERTFVMKASTACEGNVELGKAVSGEPVDCSAFAGVPKGLAMPLQIWVLPGGSTAESVVEIFRP